MSCGEDREKEEEKIAASPSLHLPPIFLENRRKME